MVLLVAALSPRALFWELRTKDPQRRQPLKEAHAHGRRFTQPAENRNRLLVVANRTLASDALRAEIKQRAGAGAEIHIVAPILCSRLHYIATDVDRELQRRPRAPQRRARGAREQGVDVDRQRR